MTISAEPTGRADPAPPIPATDREHAVTVLLGLWMTVGLFLDGYFHQNLESTSESFVTPWHAIFYAGFTASTLWIGSMSRRRCGGALDWRLRALPPGYEGARVGLVLFAAGAVGDVLWHNAFGVERGIDALLSPTHLLLFAGLALVLTTPARSAFVARDTPPGQWVVVGSIVSTTALVGFFLNFAWGLGIAAFTRVPYDPVTDAGEVGVIAGVGSMLVTTAVLVGAARTMVAAGPPPVGAHVMLFGAVALLVSIAFDEDVEGVAAAIAAGIVVEALLHVARWTAGPALVTATATLWLVYLGLLSSLDGIEWQSEIWLGAVVLNAVAAHAITSQPTRSRTETA